MAYKNPEGKRNWTRKDFAAHPEKYRDRQNNWRKANPDKAKASADRHNRTKSTKYSLLKSLAKKRNLKLEITKEEYLEIIIGKLCSYCGGALSPTGMGLDRIDSRYGYIGGNVAPCCGPCNTKKGYLEGAGFIFPRPIELLKELLKCSLILLTGL